jgi:hypothetical protein
MNSFLETRWNGEAPLETVFWRDMLLVGTAINIASAAAAWGLLAADMQPALAVLLHMLPVPWNLFLIVAVWRSADREGGPPAVTAKVIGVMWLMTMFVL